MNTVSEKSRNQVIAYLNEHGASSRREIEGALRLSRSMVVRCLSEMRKRGEVMSKERTEGRASVPYYEALVIAKHDSAVAPLTLRRGPGYYLHSEHRDTNKEPPYPHQGGQGGITNPRTSTYLESVL